MAHKAPPSGNSGIHGVKQWFVDRYHWMLGLDKRFRIAIAAGLALVVAGGAILGVSLSGGDNGGNSAENPEGTGSSAPPAQTPEIPQSPEAPSADAGGLPASPNPLTGDVTPAGKILAVKIDNVGRATQARQAGLNWADVVYGIQVEGGLSRLMAVYDSNHVPASVGPVRSARETDLPILAAYGKVNFAYSGAIGGFLPDLAKANVFNVTPSTFKGFSNGGSDPTFINPARVFAAFPNAVVAPDIGLRFADAPNEPAGGTPANSVVAKMPAASFGFTWDGSKYLVSQDGRPAVTDGGQRDTTTNVIVQHVNVVPGRFTDRNAGQADNEVFSVTTGSGSADVYRNGLVYHCTWNKPTDTSPTAYTHNGAQMTLQSGRTWIVLVP